MSEDALMQLDAFVTPGELLKAGRQACKMPEKDAEERLNWAPGYVDVIERDDYQALRSPAFARGYVKAYGRLLELDEEQLLHSFDQLRESSDLEKRKRIETKPLQLQSTGVGVVVGLVILTLLVLTLWLWRGDTGRDVPEQVIPAIAPADTAGAALPAAQPEVDEL